MNRGRVKIKRKKLGEFNIFSDSQKSHRGGRPNRVTSRPIKNTGSSSKPKGNRGRANIRGSYRVLGNVKGLRSDPMRGRISNQLRMEKQQQISRRGRGGRSSMVDKIDQPKLFTIDFDARKRLEAKRQNNKDNVENKMKVKSKMVLQQARDQQKDTILSKARGFSMVGNRMTIVSRVETEKERETTFTGTSLRVTTLQTSPERLKHRETSASGNSLLITADSKIDHIAETEASDYSAFEARRKAQQQQHVNKTQMSQEPPKLSSINPISRPKRLPPPVYEYQDTSQFQVNSSKLLVSNLHPNVSQDDIYELFSAIGPIKSARMVRQSVAEVVYHNQEDAVNAHKKYHSRNLDGQPMICKLAAVEQPIYAPPSARQSRKEVATSSSPVVFTVKI